MPRFITSSVVLLVVATSSVIGGAQAQLTDVALPTARDSTSAQPAGRGWRGHRGDRYKGGGHKLKPKPRPPPVDPCVHPVIDELGVVTGNDCSSTSTSCCAPYKCSDESVRSAQYKATVDGNVAFSPAVNEVIEDLCCILPVTDITGLVCSDASDPTYYTGPGQIDGPEYCKLTIGGPGPHVDNTIVKIYGDQGPGSPTVFDQDVLDELACLCCSGFVYVTSSANGGSGGRTFTSVVSCNGASAYPPDGPADSSQFYNIGIGACTFASS